MLLAIFFCQNPYFVSNIASCEEKTSTALAARIPYQESTVRFSESKEHIKETKVEDSVEERLFK